MSKAIDINYWNNIKYEVKLMYPILTDSDLLWRDGSMQDLLKELSTRIGISWKDLEKVVNKL
ncbi:MAG: hypothetical protein JEZ09_18860 [Salinivirgaceae bacterium]|nr:hypothetical protein [Salinivirgaceae bacterium]